jgi:hypothetical protein
LTSPVSAFTSLDMPGWWARRSCAGRQIVKHDNAFAGIGQFMNHVTADIASAASNEG